jgi:hypothetical protein
MIYIFLKYWNLWNLWSGGVRYDKIISYQNKLKSLIIISYQNKLKSLIIMNQISKVENKIKIKFKKRTKKFETCRLGLISSVNLIT